MQVVRAADEEKWRPDKTIIEQIVKTAKKGDSIPHEMLEKYVGMSSKFVEYSLRAFAFQMTLERAFEEADNPVILQFIKGDLHILTDKDAILTSRLRINAKIRGIQRDYERETRIDTGGFDEKEVDEFDRQCNKHARMIEAARRIMGKKAFREIEGDERKQIGN